MLRITLKVAPRTSRPFEVSTTEEELGDLRRRYWTGRQKDQADEGLAVRLAVAHLGYVDIPKSFLQKQMEAVVAKAIASLSLWVGGIYWYMDRTPPVSTHTRVRAFFAEDGTLLCPRCKYVLCEDFSEYTEEPIEFSKTLNNPRFICPHCNSYVQVSQRTAAYKEHQRSKDAVKEQPK